MSNNEFTTKRRLATAKLEQWAYDIYIQTDLNHSYEIWQWIRKIHMNTKITHLTKKELEALHDLWNEYVKWYKEANG